MGGQADRDPDPLPISHSAKTQTLCHVCVLLSLAKEGVAS